ncbi:hypothetical protein J4427_00510 [Candidatus Woesearchaeota archaeon]|nr:hypothetical protein [Candidatus Woesearchaeota archaeon]
MEKELSKIEGIVKHAELRQRRWYTLELQLNDEAYKKAEIPKTKPIWVDGCHRINVGERVILYYDRQHAFASSALTVSAYEILNEFGEVIFQYNTPE